MCCLLLLTLLVLLFHVLFFKVQLLAHDLNIKMWVRLCGSVSGPLAYTFYVIISRAGLLFLFLPYHFRAYSIRIYLCVGK